MEASASTKAGPYIWIGLAILLTAACGIGYGLYLLSLHYWPIG